MPLAASCRAPYLIDEESSSLDGNYHIETYTRAKNRGKKRRLGRVAEVVARTLNEEEVGATGRKSRVSESSAGCKLDDEKTIQS